MNKWRYGALIKELNAWLNKTFKIPKDNKNNLELCISVAHESVRWLKIRNKEHLADYLTTGKTNADPDEWNIHWKTGRNASLALLTKIRDVKTTP